MRTLIKLRPFTLAGAALGALIWSLGFTSDAHMPNKAQARPYVYSEPSGDDPRGVFAPSKILGNTKP